MKRPVQILQTETQRYALTGVLFGFLFPVLATLIRVSNSHLPLNLSSILFVQSSDSLLWIIDTAPFFLGLFAALAGRRQDNSLRLNMELRQRENELEMVRANLEQRVEERTREITSVNQQVTRRAAQLELIANVARSTTSIQDVNRLLPYITQLISQSFGFYHVGIFLLDERKQYAILRASNSEGGERMLKRGHRLKVGEQGIVGYVTQSGKARIALDIGTDAVFFNNPDLPETHSEMALPLKSGGVLIGALDIQSTESNAFSMDDISTLSILADQAAIAIENAILYEQTQKALQDAEVASRKSSEQAWMAYAETIKARGYRYEGIKPEPLKGQSKPSDSKDVLLVPVRLRGQIIGQLKLRLSDPTHKWTEDERAIVEATADRVAIALDGARLLEDAQKRAARETFLAEVGAKLGTSFQLDSILRDTVEELGQTLKGSTVSFQLVNPSVHPSAEPTNGSSRSKSE